ncbi:MAG TPA: FAD-dependent monooxygenase, partial [Pirellulales bacterium]
MRSSNLSQIFQRQWDVVVIGAGPAGTVAARQFALMGLNTLLVERQNWPRAKVCGGCLNGTAIVALESIGLNHVLQRCQAAPIDKFVVHSGKQTATVDLPAGLAVDRMQFDAALVDAAVEAGAEFLPATKAQVTNDPPDHSDSTDQAARNSAHREFYRHIKLSYGGDTELIRAAAVIAADGLGHPSLRELNEFQSIVADSARIGLSVVADRMPASYRSGAIYMAVGRAGYVGMVATGGVRWNIAAAIDPAVIKAAVDPTHAINSILAEVGLPIPDVSATAAW